MFDFQIVGGVLTGLLSVACGWMGASHHIGFTVSSRFSWGMRGSFCTSSDLCGSSCLQLTTKTVPVILPIFVACMWFGIQAYWGGQATRVCFGALIPGMFSRHLCWANSVDGRYDIGFAHMHDYFATSSHLQTNDFIGLVIWMCLFLPSVLIKPERLQIPFVICFFLFCGCCMGLLIWCVPGIHIGHRADAEDRTGQSIKHVVQGTCSISQAPRQTSAGRLCLVSRPFLVLGDLALWDSPIGLGMQSARSIQSHHNYLHHP